MKEHLLSARVGALLAGLALVLLLIALLASSPRHAIIAQDDTAQDNADTDIFMPFIANDALPPPELDAVALEIIATEEQLSSGTLEIAEKVTISFPTSGRVVSEYKLLHTGTYSMYRIALDLLGNEQNVEALLGAEKAARSERLGKLDEDLASYLDTLAQQEDVAADQPIAVAIWLKEPAITPTTGALFAAEGISTAETMDRAAIAELLSVIDAERAAMVEATTAVAAARLSEMSIAYERATLAPVLHAEVNAETLAVIQSWSEVDRIYRAITFEPEAIYSAGPESIELAIPQGAHRAAHPQEAEPELEVARSSVYAHTVHGRNILGFNVRVGAVEVGGRIPTNNPYLDADDPERIIQDNENTCSTASSHSTGVAGIMVSAHPSRFGISPGARLYITGSCAGSLSELQAGSEAAIEWGARSLNLSWGALLTGAARLIPGAMDRYYDSLSFNNLRLLVKSAGNQGGFCGDGSGDITSPGLGYNVMSVCNYDDRNTLSWSDDAIQPCSSYRDPKSLRGDREKPEVVAPGTNINSTTISSPWTGPIGTGTSFSAPVVASAAALLINRAPWMAAWPESIKAVLMTTALHNVDKNDLEEEVLGEYDGAGGISLDYADDVAANVRGAAGGRPYTCSNTGPLNLATMSLVAGKNTRASIVWAQNPAYDFYEDQPSADLDLQVLDPDGKLVASSTHWDNPFEIVQFTPTVSGDYTLRVLQSRCSMTPARLGWAWHREP